MVVWRIRGEREEEARRRQKTDRQLHGDLEKTAKKILRAFHGVL